MQTIHTNIWAKKIFSLCLVIFTMLLFSGCYDLGSFGSDKEYCDSFGDVRLICQDGASLAKDYSFSDYFYNEKSINDFAGDIVDSDEYIYLFLPVKNPFNLSEFSLFFKSENGGEVCFSLFISDFIPEKIRGYSDPKTKEKKDSDGNTIYDGDGNPAYEDIEYDDLNGDESIYSGRVYLAPGKWNSFTAKLVSKQSTEINKYHVTSGKYIVVKFENNSGSGKDNGFDKISFSMTNLLIRAL